MSHINGKATEGMAAEQARFLLGEGQPVMQADGRLRQLELTLLRPASKVPLQLTLEAESYAPETVFGVRRKDDNTWDYWADRDNKIALVRLGKLGTMTSESVMQVVTDLQADGLRGLVLDLRWCPGGFLNEAVGVARLFLGKCTIATLKGHTERVIPSESNPQKFVDFPIVVLVNGDSCGGAELIAAALQDNDRALVAGQRTKGKASVQTVLALPVNDMGMKLTNGAFVRPSGRNLHRFPQSKPNDTWGVRPDPRLEFRVSPQLARQLGEWWRSQTLRPGSSKEALPLDDLSSDPQLEASLRTLRAMVR